MATDEVESELETRSGTGLRKWDSNLDAFQKRLSEAHAALVLEMSGDDDLRDPQYQAIFSKLAEIEFTSKFANEHLHRQLDAHRSSVSRDLAAVSARGAVVPPHLYLEAKLEGATAAEEKGRNVLNSGLATFTSGRDTNAAPPSESQF